MAKQITEEEFEQDPLLNSYAKTASFYKENKTIIIGSAVAVILVIALAIGYHYYKQSQNQEAERLMSSAEVAYLQGNYETALNGSDEDFSIGFSQVIDNYGNTKAGNLARYYAAISAYNLGNTEQALTYIKEYSVPEGILGVAPLSFHGMLLTELGRHPDAAKMYVNAAEWDRNSSTTPYNYLEAARAFIDAGNNESALRYVEVITTEYPSSSQVTEADRMMGRLSADG